jgi:hypothetical protein
MALVCLQKISTPTPTPLEVLGVCVSFGVAINIYIIYIHVMTNFGISIVTRPLYLHHDDMGDHIDSLKMVLNTPLNGATSRCSKSIHTFASLYTEYRVKSQEELKETLDSDSTLTPLLPQCMERVQVVLGFLESFNGQVCDFTATPTLACNKDSKCEVCTHETTKNDEELKKTCEKAEGYKKKLTSASEKMNGSWWGQL